jgi:Cu+-exporting ATPase
LSLSILTGDTTEEAARVSSQLSIPVLAARSLPIDKRAHILSLQANGAKVAMVGDGVNDTPVQAIADVGVLLSLSRSAMMGAADLIVMGPDLSCLPKILNISRMTKRQATRNVLCAGLYNVVAVSLAMGLGERW